jgi:hypothetical protein
VGCWRAHAAKALRHRADHCRHDGAQLRLQSAHPASLRPKRLVRRVQRRRCDRSLGTWSGSCRGCKEAVFRAPKRAAEHPSRGQHAEAREVRSISSERPAPLISGPQKICCTRSRCGAGYRTRGGPEWSIEVKHDGLQIQIFGPRPARQDGAGEHRLASHRPTGRHCGRYPRGRRAQLRPKRSAPVAVTREGRASVALELAGSNRGRATDDPIIRPCRYEPASLGHCPLAVATRVPIPQATTPA